MSDSRSHRTRLTPMAGAPLHVQAEARLRLLMADPRFAEGGEPLTDEVTLAKKWGISRNTLRQAIARLVMEGRLRRVAGRGTRVLPMPVRSGAAAWASFTREMRERGIVVKTFKTQLGRAVPPEDVAADLGIKKGAETWFLSRLRGWEGSPAILAESWLGPDVTLKGDERFDRIPLYEVLQEVSGVIPSRSSEDVRAVAAPDAVAKTLLLNPGDPVLLRRRVTTDDSRRPLEVNFNWCRSDRYSLTLESHR